MKIQIKKVGNSAGLILPREALAELHLALGDWLTVSPTADGALQLRRFDPDFDKGMEVAEKAMQVYRNALERIAR